MNGFMQMGQYGMPQTNNPGQWPMIPGGVIPQMPAAPVAQAMPAMPLTSDDNMFLGGLPGAGPVPGSMGFLDSLKSWIPDGFLGSTATDGTKTQGWGGFALGGAQALGNAYMGMKQFGLAKDQLAEGKRQFQMNWDANKTTTNTALEDRQRARVASNSGAYQSVGDYMNKNGIK